MHLSQACPSCSSLILGNKYLNISNCIRLPSLQMYILYTNQHLLCWLVLSFVINTNLIVLKLSYLMVTKSIFLPSPVCMFDQYLPKSLCCCVLCTALLLVFVLVCLLPCFCVLLHMFLMLFSFPHPLYVIPHDGDCLDWCVNSAVLYLLHVV